MINSVGIVGAGLIGRMIAVELAIKGIDVTLFDRDNREGSLSCGWAGAGMLAPYAELDSCDEMVFRLGLSSLGLWPGVLSKLQGHVFFQYNGSLVLAHTQDRSDLLQFRDRVEAKLRDGGIGHGIVTGLQYRGQHPMPARMPALQATGPGHARVDGVEGGGLGAGGTTGLPVRWVDGDAIFELEPDLPRRFSGGLFLPNEGQIDNRQLLRALEVTLGTLAVAWYAPAEVHEIEPRRVTFSHGTALRQTKKFDYVVDCRGLGARAEVTDLRGVRGELITVIAPEVHLNRPVRLMHPRYPLYVVPREDNRFLIGATQIESEDFSPITVQSALELLSAAFSIHPGFAQASIEEMRVNCRPALSDNAPRIFHQDGLLRVNGLYRHGFLISPKLVDLVVNFLRTGEMEQDFAAVFSEEKLAGAAAR
jgi:glycine oxidase